MCPVTGSNASTEGKLYTLIMPLELIGTYMLGQTSPETDYTSTTKETSTKPCPFTLSSTSSFRIKVK